MWTVRHTSPCVTVLEEANKHKPVICVAVSTTVRAEKMNQHLLTNQIQEFTCHYAIRQYNINTVKLQ